MVILNLVERGNSELKLILDRPFVNYRLAENPERYA